MRKDEHVEVLPAGTPGPAVMVPADRDAVVAQAIALIEEVPEAPESDGTEILDAILNAASWEQLNQSGKLPAAEDMAGRMLRVTGVWRRPSDLADSLFPHYLVVESIDTHTGELCRWQTSSASPTLVLAKLVKFGKLPAVVKITMADKLTARGFRPANIEVLGVS